MTNALRKHLIEVLEGGGAHITFTDVVKDFPVERAGVRPQGCPHSAWELLEHLRIAQEDILSFSTGKNYVELKWPDAYWPAEQAPENAEEWGASVEACRKDLTRFIELVRDESSNLLEPFAWSSGETLMREALLIADHNAYHLGQLLLVRRMIE